MLTIQRTKLKTLYFTEDFFGGKIGDALGLDMVLIRGGEFVMGSPKEEPGQPDNDSERPQHNVTVPTFLMGRYPVTQAQWRAVAELSPVKDDLQADPSNFKGDDRPVEQVNWYDAVEFCARLSRETGREYRLPSEAEWEYACRAGTTTPFHFGETITDEVANYNATETYGEGPKGKSRGETTPVNQLNAPNAFGLCDMHGNVWEWCQDHWHDSYKGAPTDGSAWLSENKNANRILRGGSWYNYPRGCRSAYRLNNSPSNRDFLNGFRVVCGVPRT